MRDHIYYAAVVPSDKPHEYPFVSVPTGPYYTDEPEQHHEGARQWLRNVYATEDIRKITLPAKTHDFDDARAELTRVVMEAHDQARLLAEAEAELSAVEAFGPEKFGGPDDFEQWRKDIRVSIEVDTLDALVRLRMIKEALDV